MSELHPTFGPGSLSNPCIRMPVYIGEENPRSKLTNDQRDEILLAFKKPDASVNDIAKRFGVSPTTAARTRDRWPSMKAKLERRTK